MSLPEKFEITELQKLIDELGKESDRGAALLGASWVENAIKFRIKLGFLIKDENNIIKNIFSGNGCFSTFDSCINFCYLQGYISSRDKNALNLMRKTRNDFAHSRNLNLRFSDDNISDRCDMLLVEHPLLDTVGFSENLKKGRAAYCLACALYTIQLSQHQSIAWKSSD